MHFSYVDNDKGFNVCRDAQNYYHKLKTSTEVLPASLTSIAEVMKLAGADHITVSPPLLAQLASTSEEASFLSGEAPIGWFTEKVRALNIGSYDAIIKDEAAFRIAYTRSKNGANEAKLTQAS
jgi:transaldolase